MKSKLFLLCLVLTLAHSSIAMARLKAFFGTATSSAPAPSANDNVCPICLEQPSGTIVKKEQWPFACSHPDEYFHDACLARHITERKNTRQLVTCPLCRSGLRQHAPLVGEALRDAPQPAPAHAPAQPAHRRRQIIHAPVHQEPRHWHFVDRHFFENLENRVLEDAPQEPGREGHFGTYLYRFLTLAGIMSLSNKTSSLIFKLLCLGLYSRFL